MNNLKLPKDYYADLEKDISGQVEAKRIMSAAAFVHNNPKRIKSPRVLISGSSGSGKTALAKSLATAINKPFVFINITEFTQTGYVGKEISDIGKIIKEKVDEFNGVKEDDQKDLTDSLTVSDFANAFTSMPLLKNDEGDVKKISDIMEIESIKKRLFSIFGGPDVLDRLRKIKEYRKGWVIKPGYNPKEGNFTLPNDLEIMLSLLFAAAKIFSSNFLSVDFKEAPMESSAIGVMLENSIVNKTFSYDKTRVSYDSIFNGENKNLIETLKEKHKCTAEYAANFINFLRILFHDISFVLNRRKLFGNNELIGIKLVYKKRNIYLKQTTMSNSFKENNIFIDKSYNELLLDNDFLSKIKGVVLGTLKHKNIFDEIYLGESSNLITNGFDDIPKMLIREEPFLNSIAFFGLEKTEETRHHLLRVLDLLRTFTYYNFKNTFKNHSFLKVRPINELVGGVLISMTLDFSLTEENKEKAKEFITKIKEEKNLLEKYFDTNDEEVAKAVFAIHSKSKFQAYLDTFNTEGERNKSEKAASKATETDKENRVDYCDAVVFIDEFDKIAESADSDSRSSKDNIGRIGLQRDLLGIFDGQEIDIEKKGGGLFGTTKSTEKINTSKLLFICAGAFVNESIDGIIDELKGRLTFITSTKKLVYEDYDRFFERELNNAQHNLGVDRINCKFILEEGVKELIINLTIELNNRNDDLGMRRMITIISNVLNKHVMEIAHDAVIKIEAKDITEEALGNIVMTDIKDRPKIGFC